MAQLQLPSVELESVVESALTAAVIEPISPAPDETKFPLAGDIVFVVIDPTATVGAPIDTSGITLLIGGAAPLATSETNPDFATALITATPASAFTSDQVIDIDVTFGGVNRVWSAVATDVAPPVIVSVAPQGVRTLRVIWDDTVKVLNPTAADDALNPNNYFVERQQAPTVDVLVTAVAPGPNANEVDLTLDTPATFGAQYLLTARNIVDECGNTLVQNVGDTALFSAFAPEFPGGRRFLLWEMLPLINRCEDKTGDLARWIAVLQEVTNCLLFEIDRFATLLDPDTAPEDVLDRMICDLGRPAFIEACGALTVAQKRLLISVLIDIYKQKGTDPGVVNVIRLFLGLDVTVKPYNDLDLWWELGIDELGSDGTDGTAILGPAGAELYSFDVCATTDLTEDQRSCVRDIVEYMRPSHTHFINLIEPATVAPDVIDHWELGLSELGETGTDGTADLH